MTTPPRPPWRKLLAVLVLPLVIAAALLSPILVAVYPDPPIANPFAAHPVLAQVEPQATATATVMPCDEWRMAGTQLIYKCVDDQPPYATCYQPVGGVFQCLPEP